MPNRRFTVLDHMYPEAWASLSHSTDDEWFDNCFGTSNYWDLALAPHGHKSTTVIANRHSERLVDWLRTVSHDVIVSREAGRWNGTALRQAFPRAKLVAFASHWVEDENLKGFDVVFSSFPLMPERCRKLGVRCEYLPLAFGRKVLDLVSPPSERDIPVAFFGGLGNRIWKRGTDTMVDIACGVKEFRWWGYKSGPLPQILETTYQGECWGRRYFELLMRTKICLNRHGEVADGFGNNMRQYEATGCGCCLVTDDPGELNGLCKPYRDAWDAIAIVRDLLGRGRYAESFGAFAQGHILANHCYENRVPRFLEVVENL